MRAHIELEREEVAAIIAALEAYRMAAPMAVNTLAVNLIDYLQAEADATWKAAR